MSAKYWDPAKLKVWFRPPVTTTQLVNPHELSSLYGPDLRTGNEYLDPYMTFDAWRPEPGGRCMAKTVSVRVGLDVKDAVDNGIKLDLPLVFLWRHEPRGLGLRPSSQWAPKGGPMAQ